MIGWLIVAALLGVWRRDAERWRLRNRSSWQAFNRACDASYADWKALLACREERDALKASLRDADRQIALLEAFMVAAHGQRVRSVHYTRKPDGGLGANVEIAHACPECRTDEVFQ